MIGMIVMIVMIDSEDIHQLQLDTSSPSNNNAVGANTVIRWSSCEMKEEIIYYKMIVMIDSDNIWTGTSITTLSIQ
jgi:hypothetical protein